MFSGPDPAKNWGNADDEGLWNGLLEGNRQALSELFLRYYKRLFRYGMNIVFKEEAVKDGIQQLFLRLWKKRENISNVDSVKFYLLFSLRRILLRQKKSVSARHRRNAEYIKNFSRLVPNIEQQILKKELKHERYELYQKALQSLTNRQREVLFLRLQHGMRNEEIAEIINISHQRVRNIIYEATKRLKKTIYTYLSEED